MTDWIAMRDEPGWQERVESAFMELFGYWSMTLREMPEEVQTELMEVFEVLITLRQVTREESQAEVK